jgi:transposase
MAMENDVKEDVLLMSATERKRKAILEGVKEGYFTLAEAAQRMNVTTRQARRIMRRFELYGDKGLIHKHRGNPSNHAWDETTKKSIITLCKAKYEGFGPTLAAEKLEDDGYKISDETLRLWLKSEGLLVRQRKRTPYRKQRRRKEKFVDMLQLDGSFHYWFGEDGPEECLMDLVDDATGITMALLEKEETTKAAMLILRKWIERYGIPKSIYVDLKTVYVSPKTLKLNGDELSEITAAFTHFSKACEKLGIEIIKAYSPQAKGRVERKHAVFQDRFVKELRLKNIKKRDEANCFLDAHFLDFINKKFAKQPESSVNGHRDAKCYGDLEQIFCWEYYRKVYNDWTIHFGNKCYQIYKTTPLIVRPKNEILIREHLNGKISMWFRDNQLKYEEIEYLKKPSPERKGRDLAKLAVQGRKTKRKSPWGKYVSNENKKEKVVPIFHY